MIFRGHCIHGGHQSWDHRTLLRTLPDRENSPHFYGDLSTFLFFHTFPFPFLDAPQVDNFLVIRLALGNPAGSSPVKCVYIDVIAIDQKDMKVAAKSLTWSYCSLGSLDIYSWARGTLCCTNNLWSIKCRFFALSALQPFILCRAIRESGRLVIFSTLGRNWKRGNTNDKRYDLMSVDICTIHSGGSKISKRTTGEWFHRVRRKMKSVAIHVKSSSTNATFVQIGRDSKNIVLFVPSEIAELDGRDPAPISTVVWSLREFQWRHVCVAPAMFVSTDLFTITTKPRNQRDLESVLVTKKRFRTSAWLRM